MIPQLIALDIDGTLLPPGARPLDLPNAEFQLVIGELIAAGVSVVLATGRMYPGTASIARHLGIQLPLICQQGGSTHALDGRLLREVSIDPEIAQGVVAYAKTNGWSYAWFDSQRYLVSADSKQVQLFAEVSGVTAECLVEPEASGLVPLGTDIISTPEHATAVHDQLKQQYGDQIQLVNFPSVTAAYAPLATKGQALAQLARERSIAQSAVLAIGDSVNDVSMLQWAGTGAVPEHCDGYAEAAADERLPGQGVAGVLEKLRSVLRQITAS